MVDRAMFGGSVILLLMAFVNSAEQLVLLRAIQGLVTGTVSAANALVASIAPREHADMVWVCCRLARVTG
jgi:DHA1 family multidrug resistance protein-like MFS transporter